MGTTPSTSRSNPKKLCPKPDGFGGVVATGEHICFSCGDRISGLPDDVLGYIISLLPTDEGARTQILSTRWRNLWKQSPLNCCDADILPYDLRWESRENIRDIVSRVISNHEGTVRRLSLGWRLYDTLYPDLESWLGSSKFRNLEELDLWHGFTNPEPMPKSAFRLAPFLHAFTLSGAVPYADGGCVKLHSDAVDSLDFPNLEQLTIMCIEITESSLHTLLSKCPALQSLVLSQNRGFSRLHISSPKLTSFGLSDTYASHTLLKVLTIEHAPLLERVFIRETPRSLAVRILGAPKLFFFGELTCNITTFELGLVILEQGIFKERMPVNPTALVRSVKILIVVMSPPSIDHAIGLLKCFPCVQKLYVKVSLSERSKKLKYHDPNHQLECLSEHLTKFALINYQGRKRDVELAKYFLMNAKVLQVAEFVTHRGRCDDNYCEKQLAKLDSENWFCKQAQLIFIGCSENRYTESVHISHMHDMNIVDPYDKEVCFRYWRVM